MTSALADLAASAAIRILDLVCVSKSAEGGELTVVEFEEVEGMAALEKVDGDIGGLLSAQDIETASVRSPRAHPRSFCSWRTGGRRAFRGGEAGRGTGRRWWTRRSATSRGGLGSDVTTTDRCGREYREGE